MKLFKYKTIRFYQHAANDEFINVGVWVWDESQKKNFSYITNEDFKKLTSKCSFIDKKLLKMSLESLKCENSEANWYDNHLRFSKESAILHDDLKSALTFLYNQKIGDKLKDINFNSERAFRFEKAKQNAIDMIETYFKNDLEIADKKGYSLYLINKHSKKKIYSRLGDIANLDDTKNAFVDTIKPGLEANYFYFLQTLNYPSQDKNNIKIKEQFEKINLSIKMFHTPQEQEKTLKELASKDRIA